MLKQKAMTTELLANENIGENRASDEQAILCVKGCTLSFLWSAMQSLAF